jgi:Ca2+/H+ antiporter
MRSNLSLSFSPVRLLLVIVEIPMSADSVFWLVFTVNIVVQGGKSNWLKGMILICTYKLLFVPASPSLFHDR